MGWVLQGEASQQPRCLPLEIEAAECSHKQVAIGLAPADSRHLQIRRAPSELFLAKMAGTCMPPHGLPSRSFNRTKVDSTARSLLCLPGCQLQTPYSDLSLIRAKQPVRARPSFCQLHRQPNMPGGDSQYTMMRLVAFPDAEHSWSPLIYHPAVYCIFSHNSRGPHLMCVFFS